MRREEEPLVTILIHPHCIGLPCRYFAAADMTRHGWGYYYPMHLNWVPHPRRSPDAGTEENAISAERNKYYFALSSACNIALEI